MLRDAYRQLMQDARHGGFACREGAEGYERSNKISRVRSPVADRERLTCHAKFRSHILIVIFVAVDLPVTLSTNRLAFLLVAFTRNAPSRSGLSMLSNAISKSQEKT